MQAATSRHRAPTSAAIDTVIPDTEESDDPLAQDLAEIIDNDVSTPSRPLPGPSESPDLDLPPPDEVVDLTVVPSGSLISSPPAAVGSHVADAGALRAATSPSPPGVHVVCMADGTTPPHQSLSRSPMGRAPPSKETELMQEAAAGRAAQMKLEHSEQIVHVITTEANIAVATARAEQARANDAVSEIKNCCLTTLRSPDS